MINGTQERDYTNDANAYAVFVGQITPQEFLKGFEGFDSPADEAVKSFLKSWPYVDEAPPSWLEGALYRYVESAI